MIRRGIPWLKRANSILDNRQNNLDWWSDIGFWIGLFETIIIFVFVLNKEFSGLALIFGAKEFVRKEEIKEDPTYYLLGTLINFGVSLLIIEIALQMISFMTHVF
jgi:hypothetical protein